MQSLMTRLLLGGGGGFSPSALFSSGEQGAWYDPSDLTTLFQDSAGTTPVTAVEQPVGLVLDKSKGLVLGSELVTNGDFSSGTTTGWTALSGGLLSVVSGQLKVENSGTFGRAYQAVTVTANQWYEVRTIAVGGTANATIRFGNSGAGSTQYVNAVNTTGTFVWRFYATTTTIDVTLYCESATVGATVFFDNISVKALPGNHAYQTTSASRPTLRARYNLLTYSEQFDNVAWSKSNVTIVANQAVAPDGTTTADLMYPTTSGNDRGAFQSVTLTANTPLTYRTWVRNAGKNFVAFTRFSGAGYAVWVDLTNGATSNLAAGYTASTTATANGWTVTITGPASAITYVQPTVCDAAGSIAVTANGTDGIFIWGAQLTQTAVFPSNTYQRIAAATDYATGAAFPPYLFFDGVDDSLLTNSVDFSATDKMTVWAGVTKSSDAARGMLLELSAVATNPGAFYVAAPDTAGTANYGMYLDPGAAYQPTTYTAPISNVISVAFNRAGATLADRVIPRVNGIVNQTNPSTATPTGNFGNYPIYIGRRNNATLPLNGNIYSLIIRGAQSTSDQIISTEQWVAQKSGITIP